MLVTRAHVIEIAATKDDISFFEQCCGTSRYIFNNGLRLWQFFYHDIGIKPNANMIRDFFVHLKRGEENLSGEYIEGELAWMNDMPKSVVQEAIKDLRDAYTRFFKKQNRHPKEKRKKDSRRYACVNNDPKTIKVEGKRAWIPKIGWIQLKEAFRWPGSKMISLRIKKKGRKWFLVVNAEIEIPDRTYNENQVVDGAGDLGLSSAITYGVRQVTIKLVAPKPYKKGLGRLRWLQRELARKQYGSKNWYQAKETLAAYHYHIACRREDWQHKLTHKMAKQYELLYLEDLNIEGMMKDPRRAGAIADVAWGEIRRQLEYKTNVLCVGRFFPSTKRCNTCANVQEVALSERRWACVKCGVEHDRDENAKNNIYDEGRRLGAEMEDGYRAILPSLVAAKLKYAKYEKI